MPINIPPRGALASRQARPLNGKEVADAIENHLLVLSTRLIDDAGVLSDRMIPLLDKLKVEFRSSLQTQSRLQKIHLTYPRVGWSIKTRLEQSDAEVAELSVSAEIEIDLERNVRLNMRVGSPSGTVISSLEEEKIPTQVPDRDRQKFGLPVNVEFPQPDGTVGRVDLTDLQPKEKRAARTVDVGSGAIGRQAYELPTQNEKGEIVTQEVMVAGVGEGQVITLPDPEVELSLDVVATPPTIETQPPTAPLPPPNAMVRPGAARPNVKFKR